MKAPDLSSFACPTVATSVSEWSFDARTHHSLMLIATTGLPDEYCR